MKHLYRVISNITIFFLINLSFVLAEPSDESQIMLPEDFLIKPEVLGLASPSMSTFDDRGRMLILESGSGQNETAKITRIEGNGAKITLLREEDFRDSLPLTAIAYYEGKIYIAHGEKISHYAKNQLYTVVDDLPSTGDHGVNAIVFHSDLMYFSVGTMTNSAVVGEDNSWLGDEKLRDQHDIACYDVLLTGHIFETKPSSRNTEAVRTTPFSKSGTILPPNSVIKGEAKCSGAILRAKPDGSNLKVVAWGLRDIADMRTSPDGHLYSVVQGYQPRGLRPVANAWDCFYKIEAGNWYGWPDFACGTPLIDGQFQINNKADLGFLIANHPLEDPPKPLYKIGVQESMSGFAFAHNNTWGRTTDAFIALSGAQKGGADSGSTARIIKLDTISGQVSDFITNKTPDASSRSGGLGRPVSVIFGPDQSMYITDMGTAEVKDDDTAIRENSGAIWRVTGRDTTQSAEGRVSEISILDSLAFWFLIGAMMMAGAAIWFISVEHGFARRNRRNQ